MSFNLNKIAWTMESFGDVIDSITERVDNPSEAGVDRYVGLEHLDPGVMTVQRWDSPDKVEAQKLRFHPGDVIFGRRRAYQKKVARADFEGICSAHALVLRAKPGRMVPDFLPVFLSSDYFLDRAISISVGSLSPTINWRDLKMQQFLLPPLDEQQRIADLLWAVERYLSAQNALNSLIKACQPSLMGNDGPTTRTLADVVSVARSGATPPRAHKHFYGEGVPWLKSGEVTGDNISASEESITQAGVDNSAVWIAPAGSVVVAMYGETRGQAGRILVPMTTNQAVLALIPNDQLCDPDFFYYWIRSRYLQLRNKGAGAAQKNLSKSLILAEPFPELTVGEQKIAVEAMIQLNLAVDKISFESTVTLAMRNKMLVAILGNA